MEIPQNKIILFDLGGVILNIDYSKTTSEFKTLLDGQNSFEYTQQRQSDLFDKYETGLVSTPQFLNTIKSGFPKDVSIYAITKAWNAMLGPIPQENILFLERLRNTNKIALLSNTNDLHTSFFNRKLKNQTGQTIEHYFDHCFLSHEIGKRKPHKETFLWIAEQLEVEPADIFFMDDSKQHVEGALKVGMKAHLYPQNTLLKDYFKSV